LPGVVRHVFTHFDLELSILVARVPASTDPPAGGFWVALDALGDHPLPTLMKKVAAAARG
jgi:A/G-specific adenine glycosylase